MPAIVGKAVRKAVRWFRREVMRDPFLLQVKRWVKDNGDHTLRLDYPLNEQSTVWDVGGYKGDFAAQIHERYGCRVFVFEPVPAFHASCVARFAGNEKIRCLKFGLSGQDGWFDISQKEDASSFLRNVTGATVQRVQLRSVAAMFDELAVGCVDLLKINIEGGEYEVLPALVEAGLIDRVRFIQVQFHDFITGAREKRCLIRAALRNTHVEMWNYPFVWESWAPTRNSALKDGTAPS